MKRLAASILGVPLAMIGISAHPLSVTMPATYTAEQATRGKALYTRHCAECHGDTLDNGAFGPPLRGASFVAHWRGKGLDAPFRVMLEGMPPNNPGALGAPAYADVLAYMLRENGVAPSQTALPSDPDRLAAIGAPKPAR